MKNIAVAVFGYNRPQSLSDMLDALAVCTLADQTDVYIFLDGAKNAEDNIPVKICSMVANLQVLMNRFHTITVTQRDYNWGLKRSILQGVTSVLKIHESVIVLEDDIIVSPAFLNYMSWALEDRISSYGLACVSGYAYPIPEQPHNYVLEGADCWAWGTWRDVWSKFMTDVTHSTTRFGKGYGNYEVMDQTGEELYSWVKSLSKEQLYKFNMLGSFRYDKLLRDSVRGKNNSWAVLWYTWAYKEMYVTLYPGKTLAKNVGLDGGTHGGVWNETERELSDEWTTSIGYYAASNDIAKFFRKVYSLPVVRFVRKIINIINNKNY